jgi:hypothetical protein
MSDEPRNQEQTFNRIHIHGDVGPGAAIGPGSKVEAENIAGRDIITDAMADTITKPFASIYVAIDARSFPSKEDAQDTREIVEVIEAENKKGEEANEEVVRMGLRALARMAPDIWEVIVATLANPVLGISTVVKKIAEKAKAEAGSQGTTA